MFWTQDTHFLAQLWPRAAHPSPSGHWHRAITSLCVEPQRPRENLSYAGYHASAGSAQPTMSKRRRKTHEPMKTRSIRLYPTCAQKNVLQSWFRAARQTWNAGVIAINEDSSRCNLRFLQQHCVRSEAIRSSTSVHLQWIDHVPDSVRANAAADLISSYKTAWSNLRNGLITHFEMKRRSIRYRQQITLDARLFNSANNMFCAKLWPKALGPNERYWLKSAEALPVIDHACHITYLNGQYYIHVPLPIESNMPGERKSVVAIDPGVRTFATCYDGDQYMEYGKQGNKALLHHGYRMDHLRSKMQYVKDNLAVLGKNKRHRLHSMRRALARMGRHLKAKVTALHHQLAKDLCQNYNVVLLPTFDSSELVVRNKRRIGRRTTRALLTWSHYSFKQHLLHKAREYGTDVRIVGEEYTSRTRGCCGHLSPKSSNKVLTCPQCHTGFDRDFDAARNILLKWLTEGCPGGPGTTPL